MNIGLRFAAFSALAAVCLVPRAEAGCVIPPDGKSINVITDNGSGEEKSCAVKCQVDTKVGVAQVGCGRTTPPFAKAHSLCDFDKPERWYRKVISAEDTCKVEAASGPKPAAAAAPAVKPGTFICRIAAAGLSFDAMIANPYARQRPDEDARADAKAIAARCTEDARPDEQTLGCLDRETIAAARDHAEAGKPNMGAGDGEPLTRRPIEHLRPRGGGHFSIDVVDQPGVRPRQLHRSQMNDVAPNQDALATGRARTDVTEGVVPVAAHRQDAAGPGDLLAQPGIDRLFGQMRSHYHRSTAGDHRRSVGG